MNELLFDRYETGESQHKHLLYKLKLKLRIIHINKINMQKLKENPPGMKKIRYKNKRSHTFFKFKTIRIIVTHNQYTVFLANKESRKIKKNNQIETVVCG